MLYECAFDPSATLLDVLHDWATLTPDADFLVEDKHVSLSYSQAYFLSTTLLAQRIRHLCFDNLQTNNKRVLILSPNNSLFPLSLWALWSLNAVAVLVSASADPSLWAGQVDLIKPSAVLVSSKLHDRFLGALSTAKYSPRIVVFDNLVPEEYRLSAPTRALRVSDFIPQCLLWLKSHFEPGEPLPKFDLQPNAPVATLFTSSAVDASTLKCVTYTHGMLVMSGVRAMQMLGGEVYYKHPNRHMGWMPLSHCFEFCITLAGTVLRTGGAYIFHDREISSPHSPASAPLSSLLLSSIRYHQPVHTFCSVPSIFTSILSLCTPNDLQYLQSLKSLGVGGAPTDETVFQWAAEVGIPYFDCSGATEACGTICIRRALVPEMRSHGLQAIPGLMGVIEKEKEDDQFGELIIRATHLPTKYDNHENEAFAYDPATGVTTYRTGDLYKFKSVPINRQGETLNMNDGLTFCPAAGQLIPAFDESKELLGLTYLGRKDDLVVFSTGVKVDALTLERGLNTHSLIGRSCIVANRTQDALLALIEPVRKLTKEEVLDVRDEVMQLNEHLPFEKKIRAENVVQMDLEKGEALPLTTKFTLNRKKVKKIIREGGSFVGLGAAPAPSPTTPPSPPVLPAPAPLLAPIRIPTPRPSTPRRSVEVKFPSMEVNTKVLLSPYHDIAPGSPTPTPRTHTRFNLNAPPPIPITPRSPMARSLSPSRLVTSSLSMNGPPSPVAVTTPKTMPVKRGHKRMMSWSSSMTIPLPLPSPRSPLGSSRSKSMPTEPLKMEPPKVVVTKEIRKKVREVLSEVFSVPIGKLRCGDEDDPKPRTKHANHVDNIKNTTAQAHNATQALLNKSTCLSDIPLTSLSSLQLAKALKSAFGVQVTSAQLYGVHTIEGLCELIATKMEAQGDDRRRGVQKRHSLSGSDFKSVMGADYEMRIGSLRRTGSESDANVGCSGSEMGSRATSPTGSSISAYEQRERERERERWLAPSPLGSPRPMTPGNGFNPGTDFEEDDLVVTGAACRFPGGIDNLASFWSALIAPETFVDKLDTVPPSWRWPKGFDATKNKDQMPPMAHLPLEFFDPLTANSLSQFFGIKPSDAESMSPNARLALMVGYEAIEDAGVAPKGLGGQMWGVFTSCNDSGWRERRVLEGEVGEYGKSLQGSADDAVGARLSYFLNLTGPAIEVKTACSSSAVAIHQACNAIKAGDCTAALIIACSTHFFPAGPMFRSHAGIASRSGRCNTFSDSADGFLPSEGAVAIVVQRAGDVKGNDVVYAKVRGSAVAQDGRGHGFHAPNPVAQKSLLERAMKKAGVDFDDVAFIEAHGTGTQIGDAIEMQAIKEAFSSKRSQPLYVGAVKAVIGHTEECAGLAGVLKSILCFKYNIIPPQPYLGRLNETIDFEAARMIVPTDITPFPALEDRPRMIGVSSFGLSGTLAHIILEEPRPSFVHPMLEQLHIPRPITPASPNRPRAYTFAGMSSSTSSLSGPPRQHLLVLSARTRPDLSLLVKRYQRYIASSSREAQRAGLEAICRTSQTGRDHWPYWRKAICASDWKEVNAKLQQPSMTGAARNPKVGLWFGMPHGHTDKVLPSTEHLSHLIPCDTCWAPEFSYFATQLAVARTLMALGVEVAAVGGEGLAEYVAGICAGVLKSDDVFRFYVTETHADHDVMFTVKCDRDDLEEALLEWRADEMKVWGVHGDDVFTLVGKRSVRDQLSKELGVEVKEIKEMSAVLASILSPLASLQNPLGPMTPSPTSTKIYSGHLGSVLPEQLRNDIHYWQRVGERAVDSPPALAALSRECDILLNFTTCSMPSTDKTRVVDVPNRSIEEVLASLWESGCEVDWTKLHQAPEGMDDEDDLEVVIPSARVPTYAWATSSDESGCKDDMKVFWVKC